jgi:2-acylglycerol O-acyltransferase 2
MATTEVPLRAESTVLEEPEKQQLLPKSYAEVLEEGLPANEGTGVDDTNGMNGTMNTKRTNGTAPVLRIVDTDAPVEKKEGERGNGPQLENNGSNHAYVTDVGIPIRIY